MASIWDNFDITKISDSRFKFEFVSLEMEGDHIIGEIELEYIAYEIAYWCNTMICYFLGAYPH